MSGTDNGREARDGGGQSRLRTRHLTVALVCLLLALLLALDLSATPPNPYAAPALLAIGSGAAPTGGFCGAPAPPAD